MYIKKPKQNELSHVSFPTTCLPHIRSFPKPTPSLSPAFCPLSRSLRSSCLCSFRSLRPPIHPACPSAASPLRSPICGGPGETDHSLFRLTTIHIIIGAPKTAVTALMGSVWFDTGICDMISHVTIKMLPDMSVAGIMIL